MQMYAGVTRVVSPSPTLRVSAWRVTLAYALIFFSLDYSWVEGGKILLDLTFFKHTMTYVPEPAATNIPVQRMFDMESALLIPRSAFCDIPSLPCLHRSINENRQWCKPLRHPCPDRSGAEGNMVSSKMSHGVVTFYICIPPVEDCSFTVTHKIALLSDTWLRLSRAQCPPTIR